MLQGGTSSILFILCAAPLLQTKRVVLHIVFDINTCLSIYLIVLENISANNKIKKFSPSCFRIHDSAHR